MSNAASLTLTGTGTSMGVPMIGCECDVCTSTDPHDTRCRSGVVVRNGDHCFLIDAGPDLRTQLIRESVRMIDGVVFTHAHADHILGLDDLRIFGFRSKKAVPLYCEEMVERTIRRTFAYAFDPKTDTVHSKPMLDFHTISTEPFKLSGLTITPIRFIHGSLPVFGYRINNVAFCTDVSFIPEESWPLLENLDVLILGAIREEPHPAHFNLDQALKVVEHVCPKKAFFTHIAHNLGHRVTTDRLPEHVELAYDGLTIPL